MSRKTPKPVEPITPSPNDMIDALRWAGCTVVQLTSIDCLLVGVRGLNLLLLVKSKRHLTHEQKAFLKSWTGQIAVVSSPEAALVKAEKMARRADQIRDRILNEPKAG